MFTEDIRRYVTSLMKRLSAVPLTPECVLYFTRWMRKTPADQQVVTEMYL
jgi:hypothetical protein